MDSQRRLLVAIKSCQINGFDDRKLLVTGLRKRTRRSHLLSYFENYGIVEHVGVIFDQDSRSSRGFGFVTFTTPEAVVRVLSERKHVIDEKKVSVKIARGRIIVGGVPRSLSIDKILEYFGQFGKVFEYEIPYASEHFNEQVVTITFTSQQCVSELLKIGKHVVGGFELNVMNALQTRDQNCKLCETHRRDYITESVIEEIQPPTTESFECSITFLVLIVSSYLYAAVRVFDIL